jgi:methionyl-tRNA formyltransferase
MSPDFKIAFFGSSSFVQVLCEKIYDSQGKWLNQTMLEQLDFLIQKDPFEINIPLGLRNLLNDLKNSQNQNFYKLKDLINQSTDLQKPVKLELIVTQPDSLLRGKIIQNPISYLARQKNIPLFMPEKLSKEEEQFKSVGQSLDLAIVAAYGQIIPTSVFSLPSFGMINWHPSLLPRYRGPTPMQTALVNQDEQVGLTWIEIQKAMDAGNILLQLKSGLGHNEDFFGLSDLMASWGALTWAIASGLQVLSKTHPQELADLGLSLSIQDENRVSFCAMLTKEDRYISDTASAVEIYNHWRAYQQFPGSVIQDEFFGGQIKILGCGGVVSQADLDSWPVSQSQAKGNWLKVKTGDKWVTLWLAADKNYLIISEIGLASGKKIQLKGFNFS